MNNLQELYVGQLQDLWSANRQACNTVKELAEAASDETLRDTLQKSVAGIGEHNERLEKIIRGHNAEPAAEHCKGMEGLAAEAKKHAVNADISDDAVRDAQIIAQYQRVAHYGIAAYGTCRALAKRLGRDADARTLEGDLESVKKGDAVMTRIAEESVNKKAKAA